VTLTLTLTLTLTRFISFRECCSRCRLHQLRHLQLREVVVVRHRTLSMDTRPVHDMTHSLLLATLHSRMSVIWQGPICVERHGMGLDVSENGSAETMTDERE